MYDSLKDLYFISLDCALGSESGGKLLRLHQMYLIPDLDNVGELGLPQWSGNSKQKLALLLSCPSPITV